MARLLRRKSEGGRWKVEVLWDFLVVIVVVIEIEIGIGVGIGIGIAIDSNRP